MQPSLSLIAASISAAIALSPLGAKVSQAASLSEPDLYSGMSGDENAALITRYSVALAFNNSEDNSSWIKGAIAQSPEAESLEESLNEDTPEPERADLEEFIEPRGSEDVGEAETEADTETVNLEPDAVPQEDSETDLEASDLDTEKTESAASEPDAVAQDPAEVEPEASMEDASDVDAEDAEAALEVSQSESFDETIRLNEFPDDTLREPGEQPLPNLINPTDPIDPVDPAIFGLSDDETPVLVPEYLNAPANPLAFPTLPEEVELEGAQPITLEQAIEIARRNSTELQEALLQLEQRQAALRQEQARYLPNLNADFTLTHQGTNSFIELPPTTIGGEPTVESIYTEQTTLNGGLNLSYDIFTSGQRSALVRAAEERVRLQELQVEVVAEQLRLDVTQDYYDLQETDELVRIATQSLEEALQSLRDAQALERAGVGTRFDSLQAEVEVANSRQDLIQSLSNQEIARRQLSQRLNSNQSIDLIAADPIEVAGIWELTLADSIVLAYQNRAELEQQLVQRDVSEQQRRANLAALGPQLSAFAQYSLVDLLDQTQSSGDSETYAIGLQASIQLFDGGAARAAARQEEINIALAENSFEEAQRVIRFQVEQAFSALQANFENIQTATLAVDTATEALRLARLRFQAGVGTQTDVLQAQTDLTRAEVNRLQAVLGYNRALAQLQRSVSNLPDANLLDRS